MTEPVVHAIDVSRDAANFERTLLAVFTLLLGVTATFMPKTYLPDRYMIIGWICFVAGIACTLSSHFLGQMRCHRTRVGFHALGGVPVCLLVGLAFTVIFVSEGDDGNGEDDPNYVFAGPAGDSRG